MADYRSRLHDSQVPLAHEDYSNQVQHHTTKRQTDLKSEYKRQMNSRNQMLTSQRKQDLVDEQMRIVQAQKSLEEERTHKLALRELMQRERSDDLARK